MRNFPLVGRLRFLLESFGPELRQYIVTSNDEERPFSRDQRRCRAPVQARDGARVPLFARAGLAEDVVFVGAGRLGFPDAALHAMALGCDMINVGRESMLSIGCIQAQRCHTGGCPTGVATQSRWLMRGLDPDLKSARAANYIVALRAELLSLARACGARHPALVDPDRIEIVSARYASAPVRDVFGYEPDWPIVSAARRAEASALIGAPTPAPPPGPAAGEHAGIPGAGDPSRPHMDARGGGEAAGEAG